VTPEEKEAFLKHLRAGNSPPRAAELVNPEYTSTMFRSIASEQSRQYDPDFSAAYLLARAEGKAKRTEPTPTREPRDKTLGGNVKADHLKPETLDQFLDYVEQGVPVYEAARLLDEQTTLTQINRRADRDEEFATRYAEAKKSGYPSFQEGIRAVIVNLAQGGEYRAAKDLAVIHLPEWRDAFLTTKHEIGGMNGQAIRLIAEQALPGLPDVVLDQLIEATEQRLIEASGE
jgi:hypothetical protein